MISHYIASRRIEQAKHLLRHTRLGFPNARHFSIRFRRVVGAAPSEYRNEEPGEPR